MRKIDLFKTRVVMDDKVYLLASDVRKALGYESIALLEKDHADIVKNYKGLPRLVCESDFNAILLLSHEAAEKLGHIEISRVETLRSKTELIKSFYPLKYMVAKSMFELDAVKNGCQSVEEYIEKLDYVREIDKAKFELIEKAELLTVYERSKKKLEKIIDYRVLEKCGLQVQQYIHIRECVPYLESFIVGEGVFFSIYDSDYAFDQLMIENDDLIIPTYDGETDYIDKNYGHDPDMRDYRKHGTLENLLYLITHRFVEDVGVDLMCCEAPGISFYISQIEVIKLLNPNLYRDVVLIDGDIEFDYSKIVT